VTRSNSAREKFLNHSGALGIFYPLRLTEPRSDEIQPERGGSNFRRIFIWLSQEVSGN
jgi:hypothetical protein